MRPIIFITILLFITGCDSAKQRIAWITQAIHAKDSQPHPTQTQLDAFFGFRPGKNHPYLNPEFQKELDSKTHSRLTAGNQINLLPNSKSVELKLNLIKHAKKRIWISTFQIVCDAGGKIFAKALTEATERGIDVRFLVTGGPWTWAFSGECPVWMEKQNIQVATMPYSYVTNHGVVQLHDKIFLVDSELAIVGGQNIGSWYSKKKEEDGNFRDTDAIVSGPVVQDILKRFVILWKIAKPNDSSLKTPLIKATPEHYATWFETNPTQGLCRFVAQMPSQKDFSVFEAYRLYAAHTEQRIVFHSPALNAFRSLEQETLWASFVKVAQKSGSEVFLLTNGPGFISSDMMPPWVGKIMGYYFLNSVYDSLFGTPIQAFAYPSWLHSKVYFFDNLAVAIGSFNFDESGVVWTESSLICLDKNLADQTISMFKQDLKSSYLLNAP